MSKTRRDSTGFLWYNQTMKRINTSKISGTQELLPGEQAIFSNLNRKITDTYYSHG